MQFIRVFATLLAFAAASALAGPVPAKYNVLVREPETPNSDLEVLAREPENVEARDPGCGLPRMGGAMCV